MIIVIIIMIHIIWCIWKNHFIQAKPACNKVINKVRNTHLKDQLLATSLRVMRSSELITISDFLRIRLKPFFQGSWRHTICFLCETQVLMAWKRGFETVKIKIKLDDFNNVHSQQWKAPRILCHTINKFSANHAEGLRKALILIFYIRWWFLV